MELAYLFIGVSVAAALVTAIVLITERRQRKIGMQK